MFIQALVFGCLYRILFFAVSRPRVLANVAKNVAAQQSTHAAGSSLTLGGLKRRARHVGVLQEEIDVADEHLDPKKFLTKAISTEMNKQLRGMTLGAMKRHAKDIGITQDAVDFADEHADPKLYLADAISEQIMSTDPKDISALDLQHTEVSTMTNTTSARCNFQSLSMDCHVTWCHGKKRSECPNFWTIASDYRTHWCHWNTDRNECFNYYGNTKDETKCPSQAIVDAGIDAQCVSNQDGCLTFTGTENVKCGGSTMSTTKRCACT